MEFKWYYNENLTHFEFYCTLNQIAISHAENVQHSHSTTKIGVLSNKKALKGGIYLEGVISTMIESVLMVFLAQLPND